MSLTAQASPQTRLFTVDEYYQMLTLGILSPEERTELIDGEITLMAAKNPLHSRSTKRTYDYLLELLKEKAVIRSQEPIRLSDHSLPEPDIAIVRLPEERYDERHPNPEDIYWLIEVSDTTLHYDLNTKSNLYAQANINEYWVIDAIERHVYIHQNPHEGGYKDKTGFRESDSLYSLAFPDVRIELSRFFAPKLPSDPLLQAC